MSSIDHTITTSELIPVIQDAEWIFGDHEANQFALAKIAVGNVVLPGFESVYKGYMMVRGRVYAEKTRMIDRSRLNADGSEIPDADDYRSVHFAVVENVGDSQRVVATTRHIIQDVLNPEPLPIAKFFPGCLPDFDLSSGIRPFEVSRWIQLHENKLKQAYLARPLLRATLVDALAFERIPSFCTVEKPVAQHLKALNVDICQISEPRFVSEYDDVNVGYEINLTQTARRYSVTAEDIQSATDCSGLILYFGRLSLPKAVPPTVGRRK